ncbi:MAG TPA: DUF2141 domain-containing protein [Saprospiraceae bacterium]|nr:DUF2141 domain-containing protein [Saprospiraceae bacterium]HNL37828.1 DUF2141 domain-containing protein [Saprospiraceae bacterium]HNM26368.1 DUF2141 domain-containing protein [Saprospiraceae bacterium]
MLLPLLFALTALPVAPELRMTFTNLNTAKGQLYVAVYDNAGSFLKPEKVVWKAIVPVSQAGSLELSASGLRPGVYAVSCFHDLNNNGKLDTNLFGVPTEPYGFSNNVRPTFRAPNWEEARFELRPEGSAISIRLEKW